MQRAVTRPSPSAPPPRSSERAAPHNFDLEQALLGAILLREQGIERVIDFLEPEHFFDALHGQFYRLAVKLYGENKRVTPFSVAEEMGQVDAPDGLTAQQYLGRLATRATTLMNVEQYGKLIRDLALRRSLILIAEDIAQAAYEASADEFPPLQQIEEAETRLFALTDRSISSTRDTFEAATGRALGTALRALNGQRIGVPTGLADLDSRLGGLQPSDLVVLAGRPGMAKSALAASIAVYNAKTQRTPVGFFSLEMSNEQIANRVLGDQADIPPDDLRRGRFDRERVSTLQDLALLTGQFAIRLDDTGALSIAQLSTRARRMKRQFDIGLLVVDYLQLMNAGRKTENRVQDVTAITTGLKALAKELNIPVLALSQLSRAVENRDNKRPQLSDLRESGSIEQDADVVMFLYREEYYLDLNMPQQSETIKYGDWLAEKAKARGKAEIIIGKHRHGPTGVVNVFFNAPLMRFGNLAGNLVPTQGGAS